MKNEGIDEIRNNFYKTPCYIVRGEEEGEEDDGEETANNNEFEKNADNIEDVFWFQLNCDKIGFKGGRIYDEVKYDTWNHIDMNRFFLISLKTNNLC